MKREKYFNVGPGSYFGGKGASGVVHTIINQIPKHEIFISGFLGCCQVMQWKKPAHLNIGYDKSQEVVDLWKNTGINECQRDFIEMLQNGMQHTQLKDTFLYLDPPYLFDTRRNQQKRYKYELTEKDHHVIFGGILSLPCMVMLSHYPCGHYDALLKDPRWRKIEFQAQTRGGMATEAIYMNYPEPTPEELHDTAFLGANYRQREVSARRLATLRGKIMRLTPQEKAILATQLPAILPQIKRI